jgi:hypothetical protein
MNEYNKKRINAIGTGKEGYHWKTNKVAQWALQDQEV